MRFTIHHQMAHGGVVPHSSSWTPAAYELEESSLDSHIRGLPEPPDGRREQGDKVVYILMGLTAGNAAGYRGGVINTGIEDILVLPAVSVVPLLPGPALRDGFSHVLGLRIVVPQALRRLSGQLLRQRQSFPLQTLRRPSCQLLRQRQYLVDLSILAPISRSLLLCFTRSVRELFARAALQFLRLSCECVFRLLSTTYAIDSPAVGFSRCTGSRASGREAKTPGGEGQDMRRMK